MDPSPEPLIGRLRRLLGRFAEDHGFSVEVKDEQPEACRAWVRLESARIVLDVVRDRGEEYITITSRDRPGPRKPCRSWPLGHVVAYLDGAAAPYGLGLAVETEWLVHRAAELLDPAMLNSEALRRWSVMASRRTFGQDRRR